MSIKLTDVEQQIESFFARPFEDEAEVERNADKRLRERMADQGEELESMVRLYGFAS